VSHRGRNVVERFATTENSFQNEAERIFRRRRLAAIREHGLACGGRAELMRHFDPSRPDALQHGGTFNNDVLTLADGVAGLTRVLTLGEIERLNGLGDRLRDRLNWFASERGIDFCSTG